MSQGTVPSRNVAVGPGWPVRVAVVDVAYPVGDLDCSRSSAPPYTSAWILVCRSGYPLGIIEMPLDGTVITAAELEYEINRQLGEAQPEAFAGGTLALPRASVVVPSNFARPAQLRRCAERLMELDYPDYEVIVVDNRPGNVSEAEIPGVQVVREPHPGISAARNRGIAVATGDIIAFTDDDAVVDRRWLRAIGERFAREPEVVAVTGLNVPLELETSAQALFEQSGNATDRSFVPLTFEHVGRFQVQCRPPGERTGHVHSIYMTGELGAGLNMAFRTAVLRAAGGFDEALGTGTPACSGEDHAMLLGLLTAGNRLAFEPGAIVQHSHRATLEELKRQIHGYGIGFTAMLTALALRNPRHVLGLASVLPTWLRSLRDPTSGKNLHRTTEYPRALARAELLGMATGPFAYLRSRLVQRRWTRQ
jgi:GT2 family glycosyltransferase